MYRSQYFIPGSIWCNKFQNVTLKIMESQLLPEIKKEPSITDIQKCDKESTCDKSNVRLILFLLIYTQFIMLQIS